MLLFYCIEHFDDSKINLLKSVKSVKIFIISFYFANNL